MGGARSSFTTTSSPTIYSTSVTDSKAMQVESCSLTIGVSNRGVSEKQLTNKAVQQQQSAPIRWRVLSISPPPEDLLDNSQMSCQDAGGVLESEQSSTMWMDDSTSNFSNLSTRSYNDNTEVPRKSRKRNTKERPGIKRHDCEESNMDVFDADSAKAPHYVLSQLTNDSKGSTQAGNGSEIQKAQVGKKSPTLCGQYPSKSDGKELKIVVQPETQHRARYLTEGSRGSVKDRTQQSFPTIKLEGYNEPVVLQVFVGNDSGRVKPHGFYQACRVTGRNTTPCKEVDIEGTTVIEVNLDPSNMMALAVDCVGILKLRNADVEARIGIAGSKKKSTRARLVFRVNIARKDGSVLTLQTPSSPILCTQPAGLPEILKKSLHSCSVEGQEEVFLIGKNFLKGAKVLFQDNIPDEDSWKAEAEIDMEFFHQNHLVVKVPPYQDLGITSPVSVGIFVVTNAGKSHEVHPFVYTPATCVSPNVLVKKELDAPAQSCSFEHSVKAMEATTCNRESGNLPPSALTTPHIQTIIVKSEDLDSMDLTAESEVSPVYKTTNVGVQPLVNMSSSGSFSPSVSLLEGESAPIQTKSYNPEIRSPLETQDISQSVSFQSVSGPRQHHNSESLLQQTAPFPGGDSQSNDVLQSEASVSNLSKMAELSQQAFGDKAQTLRKQISSSMFSSSGISQLQNSIHQRQSGSFPASPANGSSGNVDLVQQVLEAQQKLSAVLFSGPNNNENSQSAQDQMSTDVFQQVNQIQGTVGSGMFSSPDTTVHSRSDGLSGRSENVIQQTKSSLSNQQQAMETSASLGMGMQQTICQAAITMESDIFPSSSSGTGSIQHSPVYHHGSHILSGLSPSEELHMQCDLFPSSSLSGDRNSVVPQQVPTTSTNIFQGSNSADGDKPTGQAKQMTGNIFQSMVQMHHSGENQPQVNLFSPSEMLTASGSQQQQGSGHFQQAGEMMTLQSGAFMQPSQDMSQTPLYHTSNSIGDTQNMSQETQRSLFHNSNPIEKHQNPVSSPDQMQSPLFHPPNSMAVLQSASISPDHQTSHIFISQNSLNSLQNNSTPQEKTLSFFTNPNPHNSHQAATNAEQQSTFQPQAQMSHIQSPVLSPEQESQQGIFQSQQQPQTGLFQSQQQPQQGLFQSQQQPKQNRFQSQQQSPQEMFQSQQQSPQEMFQSQQQSPQEMFQSQQQSPQEMFQSQQQSPQEMFQSQQQSPQEMFQSQSQPPQEMFQSQQQPPQEMFQSQSQPPQEMFQSQSQPPQEMFQSQQQPPQEMFQSQQQPPQEMFQSQQQPPQEMFQSQPPPPQEMFQSQQQPPQEMFQSQQQPPQEMFQSQQQPPQEMFQSQQQPPQEMFQSQQQPPQEMFQSQQQPPQEMFQSQQQPPQEMFQSQQQPPQEMFQSQQQPPQEMFQSQQPSPQEMFQSQQHPPQDMFKAQQQPQQDMFKSQQQPQQDIFQSQQQQPQRDMFQSQQLPQQDVFQSQSLTQQDVFQSQQLPHQDMFQSHQQTQQDMFQSQQQPPQELFQSQSQPQQDLFQSQMAMAQNHQGPIFQSPHSIVGLQGTSAAQDQQQGIVFSNQNTMTSEEQQSMLYTTSQSLMANQEQQNQSLFHSQNRTSLNREEQPMQFEGQNSVSSIQSSGSSQSEQQQSSIFHNSPQIQMVQGSPTTQEQQVTLFITSASMSALQNSISQQELKQPGLFSTGNSLGGMQGNTSPSQQQAALYHSTGAGTLTQLQNPPASSQQTSGIFLFGIQNNCSQLLSPAQSTVPDELMALSQEGQAQDEGQSVAKLLSQQMSESSSLSSSVGTNPNMEKINDLLVSLQNQGNSMSGSF
ncbi:nuclear factor of activated T-cells 5 isoform X2 [Ambystoma mexicanum]